MAPKNSQSWNKSFRKLVEFKVANGTTIVPRKYPHLGEWVHYQRRHREYLSEEQMNALASIDFIWDVQGHIWQQSYEKFVAYTKEHNTSNVSSSIEPKLAGWVGTNRKTYWLGNMSQERKDKLKAVGFDFGKKPGRKKSKGEPQGKTTRARDKKWMEKYQMLVKYHEVEGHCNVPQHYTVDDFKLGRFVNDLRVNNRRNLLSDDRKQLLEKLDFVFDIKQQTEDAEFMEKIDELEVFKNMHKHVNVRAKGPGRNRELAGWLKRQINLHTNGRLSVERQAMLQLLGVKFPQPRPLPSGGSLASADEKSANSENSENTGVKYYDSSDASDKSLDADKYVDADDQSNQTDGKTKEVPPEISIKEPCLHPLGDHQDGECAATRVDDDGADSTGASTHGADSAADQPDATPQQDTELSDELQDAGLSADRNVDDAVMESVAASVKKALAPPEEFDVFETLTPLILELSELLDDTEHGAQAIKKCEVFLKQMINKLRRKKGVESKTDDDIEALDTCSRLLPLVDDLAGLVDTNDKDSGRTLRNCKVMLISTIQKAKKDANVSSSEPEAKRQKVAV